MKSESVTIEIKATEQYFPVVLVPIMLYKVVPRFESADEILNCPCIIADPFQENKKSTKRREIDNKQLKRVLLGVIEHVRIGHVLPPHSELLEGVFRRGLADRGMPLDIGEGSFYPNLPWMRRREERDFVRPRLFLPYFEEAKVSFLLGTAVEFSTPPSSGV